MTSLDSLHECVPAETQTDIINIIPHHAYTYTVYSIKMPSPKIAIIGAGPVGTTLGRLLLRQSPSTSVTIFESEPSANYRSQGGTLDLHTATGLAAIKEAGLWDEFSKHARYDGESLLMTDKNLKPFYQVKPSASPDQKGGHLGGQRPEIDRAALRQMLIESLPADMITWGHRLKEVRPGKEPRSTKLTFTLADGSTTTASGFDLIVGADGAWSKIRGVLSDVKPHFAGVSNQAFEIPDAENTAPEVYRAVNRGSIFSHADGHKTNLQQMGDGSIVVSPTTRTGTRTRRGAASTPLTWRRPRPLRCSGTTTGTPSSRRPSRGRRGAPCPGACTCSPWGSASRTRRG